MNLYVLVEGKTEARVYPRWLRRLLPGHRRVSHHRDVAGSHFFVFDGGGYPNFLYHHLARAIEDVNEVGAYDYLLVCFDTDEESCEERCRHIRRYLRRNGHVLERAELVLIGQVVCFETWLMGNRKLHKQNPDNGTLRDWQAFYDVRYRDPERMPCHPDYGARQQFHKAYFKAMARERRIHYSERQPASVAETSFLEQLTERFRETGDIGSFGRLINFFEDERRTCTKRRR